jgi:single-strand DNA-binding protein
MATDTADEQSNHVFLRGTFAGEVIERTMPSGDELISFRVTVPRPPGGRVRVDSIDCASTRAAVRRSAARYEAGDEVELTGSLHRRFWRTPGGSPSSRYEVEVSSLRGARAPKSQEDQRSVASKLGRGTLIGEAANE